MHAEIQEAGAQVEMEVRADDEQFLVGRELRILRLQVTADFEIDRRDRTELGVEAEYLVGAQLGAIDQVEFG